MTDSQLIFGIMQNDERACRHICREMKAGFVSILGQTFYVDRIRGDDIDDIFQESLVVLMQKVKKDFKRIYYYFCQLGYDSGKTIPLIL